MAIAKGTELIVVTASGERLPMVAVDRPVRGRDFPVVRVKQIGESDDQSLPWPLEDVEESAETSAAVGGPTEEDA